jgi:Bacterial Ig domain
MRLRRFPLVLALLIAVLCVRSFAADGVAQKWAVRYNGPDQQNDRAAAIAADAAGNIFVTGVSQSSAGADDIYTAKYAAASGALLWERRYDGPGHNNDASFAIAVDANGNAVITGTSADNAGVADIYTAKYAAASGTLVWERRYNGPPAGIDIANAIALDGVGNVIVTGKSFNGANFDFYTAKYAAVNGALLWEVRHDGPAHLEDIANAVAVDAAGDVIVAGQSAGAGGDFDFYTVKYRGADGGVIWEQRRNHLIGFPQFNGEDVLRTLAVDHADNIVVAGWTGDSNEHGNRDVYTAKYSGVDGDLVWEQYKNSFDGTSDDEATSVTIDPENDVIVTGFAENGTEGDLSFLTLKYDGESGATIWERYHHGPEVGRDDSADTVRADSDGNIYVTGSSVGPGTFIEVIGGISGIFYIPGHYDYTTLSYASDGTLRWMMRYNGPADDHDIMAEPRGGKLVLTGDGGVVVTGQSSDGANDDFTTVKYVPTSPVIVACPQSRSKLISGYLTAFSAPDLTSELVATDDVAVTSITQEPPPGTPLGAGTHVIVFTVQDADGHESICETELTVVINRLPVAVADFAFSTTSGVLIDVLENDTDADAQPLTITAVTQSQQGGTVTIEGNKLRYKPGTAVTAARTFTYTISDGDDTATATVTIYRFPTPGFTYVGHLFDTDGFTHRGLLTARVANSGGTFTGSLYIGAKKYGLKGSFSTTSPTLARAGASRTFVGIPVRISAGPLDAASFPKIAFSVDGTVPGTRWRGLAERSPYFRLTTGALLSPAAGKYTIVFEDVPGSAQPVVAGGATATVKAPGSAKLTGKFGNGSSILTGAFLLSGGRALVYAPAAKGTTYQTLAGQLVFAPLADRDVSGDLLWRVPSGFDTRIPGGLARTYPAIGSRYNPLLTRLSPPNRMLDYNATGEATFHFELPSSNRAVDVLRNVVNLSVINGLPPMPQVKFAPSSGYFQGTFADALTRSAKFQGWVLQHPAQNRGNAYVLDTNRIGSVSLTPSP